MSETQNRTVYQHGYEDALDRGYNASGKSHVDYDEYIRGFRDGEASRPLPEIADSDARDQQRVAEVERLRGENRELAMQCLASETQAMEAYTKQKDAEQKLAAEIERLRAEVARLQNVIAERVGTDKEANP